MNMRVKYEGRSTKGHFAVNVIDTGVSWTRWDAGIRTTFELRTCQLLQPVLKVMTPSSSVLFVQYVKVIGRSKGRIVARRCEVVVEGKTEECSELKRQIETLIKTQEPWRPARLLVLINPTSGTRTGVRDYARLVGPLLSRCGVKTEVVVTKSAAHVSDIMSEYDISSIDGVISMGGDGSTTQVMNGLIKRSMPDTMQDTNDSNDDMVKSRLPVGSIPCGSACAMALFTCGSKDVETCVLTIILGKTTPYDVLETRIDNQCVRYGNITIGAGCMSNANMWLERMKCLGRHRYKLLFPAIWQKWKTFEVEIDYLPVPEHDRLFRLSAEADGLINSNISIGEGPRAGWKTLRCKATEVGIVPYGMREIFTCMYSGRYDKTCLSTGRALLYIFHIPGFYDSLPALMSMQQVKRHQIPRRHLEQIEVTEIRVRGVIDWRDDKIGLAIAVDGDKLLLPHEPEYQVKVHTGAMNYYCLNTDLIDAAVTLSDANP